ncbi:MAG: hypothetical protein ACYS7Y_30210 [Planctomycetota bacterium]|jgi:hypothetical protein
MNEDKKIEKCLSAAPKPAVPNDLLNKLKENVSVSESRARRSVLRRWFAPAGGPILPWRVAAAAVVAVVVLLPLGYGATKLVEECYTTFKATFIYPDHDGGGNVAYGVGGGFGGDVSEKKAMEMDEEIRRLCAEGQENWHRRRRP